MKKCKNKILMLLAVGVTMAVSSTVGYASEQLIKNEGNVEKAIVYDEGKYVFEGTDDKGAQGLFFNDNGENTLINNSDDYSFNSLNKYSQKYGDIEKDGLNYKVDLSDGEVSSTSVESEIESARSLTSSDLSSYQGANVPFLTKNCEKDIARVGTGQFENTYYRFRFNENSSGTITPAKIYYTDSQCYAWSQYHPGDARYQTSSGYTTYTLLGQSVSESVYEECSTQEGRMGALRRLLSSVGFDNVTKSTNSDGDIIYVATSNVPLSDNPDFNIYGNPNQLLSQAHIMSMGSTSPAYSYDYKGITNEKGESEYNADLYNSDIISEDSENVYTLSNNKITKFSKSRYRDYAEGCLYIAPFKGGQAVTRWPIYLPRNISRYNIKDISFMNDSDYNSFSTCPCRVVDGKLYFTQVSNDGSKVKVSVVNLASNGSAELETSVEHAIDSFNFNDKANSTDNKAYENSTIAIDNAGYTWILNDGKIYKFDGTSFNETFECDSSMDRLDVYDDNDLIVYSSKGEGYAALQNGKQKVEEEKSFTVDGIKYGVLHDDKISVAGIDAGHDGALNIPDNVEYKGKTYEVRSIGDFGLTNNTALTSLNLVSPLNFIGYAALQGCVNLNNVILPKSVTCIADSAFSGCVSLKNIVISDNVDYIGGYAFYNCAGLKNIEITGTVNTIGDCAFAGCSSDAVFTVYNDITKQALVKSGIDENSIILKGNDETVKDEPETVIDNEVKNDENSETVVDNDAKGDEVSETVEEPAPAVDEAQASNDESEVSNEKEENTEEELVPEIEEPLGETEEIAPEEVAAE